VTDEQVPGLDYDFLRYIGVEPENQRRLQSFYLPRFEGCRRVVDLACGDGDFVELLLERGIDAVGVDADDKTAATLTQRGLPFVHQDVFEYLKEAPAESADGIFCAHLVEHLPYPKVLELCRESYRMLRPGGVIVLATPNVRTIFSHLEMFYLHFGHVSFYHPRLLCFFLEHEGFVDAVHGENPETASPLLPAVNALARKEPLLRTIPPPPMPAFDYRRTIPRQGRSILHQISYSVKTLLTRWLVQPLVDSLAAEARAQLSVYLHDRFVQVNEALAELDVRTHELANSLQSINGAFECYAIARKPGAQRSTGSPHE
jgi:SAM-dependent methyltransferase